MDIKPIKAHAGHEVALPELKTLWLTEGGTAEGDREAALLMPAFARKLASESPAYPTKTIFPTCRLVKNASCAATISAKGNVAATSGLISPRSI